MISGHIFGRVSSKNTNDESLGTILQLRLLRRWESNASDCIRSFNRYSKESPNLLQQDVVGT